MKLAITEKVFVPIISGDCTHLITPAAAHIEGVYFGKEERNKYVLSEEQLLEFANKCCDYGYNFTEEIGKEYNSTNAAFEELKPKFINSFYTI